jgi:hypothetical protein
MLRYVLIAAALSAAPAVVHAQDTTHKDTTHHDTSAIKRKANNTVNNAGEGVKQANDQVDNGAYKVGTDVKNLFRGKPKKKPAKPDSSAKRDSTPH